MCQCRRYVILLSVAWLSASFGDVVRNEDICGPHNGRRLYVEMGEQGVLYASNVSLVKNSPRQDTSRAYTTNSSHDQCSLELVTCPSCVITVTFKSINLLHHCGDGSMTIDSPCRCDYVWVSEPPYEDFSGTPFCGHYAPITYRSNTRTLSIALLYSQSHKHAFALEYTAERNRLILKGSNSLNEMSKSMNNTGGGGGILTSPFFPSRYPRDLGMEYIITCPTEAPSCRVRVLFSDFQLAAVSIMEFYDWNGQRLDVSSGARFRPPIIVSTGPSLLIRFYANGGTGLGYKAFYSFVPVHLYDTHSHPITDCGGYVENLGGAITMMDMVGEGVKTYDCVWLIRPPKNFLHMKTHMYLKVITFAEMAGNTELIIKQGPTSALMPLEVLRHPVSQLQPPRLREHLAPVTSGFHVSLRGSFGPNSRLAIAYAAFSYMDCFTGSDFLCQNHRCISNQLNCDGFDHCGDNSDEPSTCLHDWDVGLPDRKWQQSKANYYFPKIDRYPDLKTATLVFVASSLGLIVLISALIILLYRVGARARQQRELQSRLRTISELLDGARIDEISVSDDPPVYEAPPNYDEVIKLGMEDETTTTTTTTTTATTCGNSNSTTRRKKRRSMRDSRRSRSIPSSQYSCDCEQQLTLNIYEDGTRSNRSGRMTPITMEQPLVPESPPPPYVTPPGTVQRNFSFDIDPLPGPSGTSGVPPIARCDTINTNSSDTNSTSPVRVQLCRGGCRDGQTRRSWLRNSSSFSRSLPGSRAASNSPSNADRNVSSSTSVDAPAPLTPVLPADNGALGAYLRAVAASASSSVVPRLLVPSQASASCPAQSARSSAASANTSGGCASGCSSAVVPTGAENSEQQLRQEAAAAELREEAEPEDEDEDDPERAERRPIVSCSCEGACGCASSGSALLVNAAEDPTGSELSRAPLIRRNSIDDSACARSRIIRLLAGSRCSNSRNSPVGATSLDSVPSPISTSCSTPCGTFGKTCPQARNNKGCVPRELSICSRDSSGTKVTNVSTYGSFERLPDDFDIVSETTSILGSGTLANTPKPTPNRFMERIAAGKRRYSTYDLDNLYESIRVLDSFLAQRGANTPGGDDESAARVKRSRPMTLVLFGTPKHGKSSRSEDGSSSILSHRDSRRDGTTRIRVWRSTDDNFAK